MITNVKATQALLDANGHLDVIPGDVVLTEQVTAPVTQAMLDADPDLVAEGVHVGDLLNPTSVPFSASITGSVDDVGNFNASSTGGFTGTMTGTVDGSRNVTGTFKGAMTP